MNGIHAKRIEGLSELHPGFIIISHTENIFYLSGFTGDNGILVLGGDTPLLITDSRYTLQAEAQCPGFRIMDYGRGSIFAAAAGEIKDEACGFEADTIGLAAFRAMSEQLKLNETHGLVESLRLTKDPGEIAATEKACRLADKAALWLKEEIRPGITEKELALELEYFMKKNGASDLGFPSIIAAGENAACPHHSPTDRTVKQGEMVKCDFGCIVDSYNADITRTYFAGEPTEEFIRNYNAVLQAQEAAIAAIKPGICGTEPDRIARETIKALGCEGCFGHGLGHGLGLNVHDSQAFSPSSRLILKPGMIATVEPGIYIPGWGGIRIEDDILVTPEGCRVLTHAEK